MAEDSQPRCDVDDLLCQMRLMSHLEGLQSIMGTDKFKEQYPDFAELQNTVTGRLEKQKENIRTSMEKCGLPIPQELEEEVQEETSE